MKFVDAQRARCGRLPRPLVEVCLIVAPLVVAVVLIWLTR